MSLPANNSPSSRNPPAGSTPRLTRAPRLRYVFALPLIVFIGSCIVIQGPREIGRWKLATALDLRAEGKSEQAYAQLTEAMRWFPDSPMLILQRAEWRLEDGQREEALADADRMLEIGRQHDLYQWLVVHGHFMQRVGEHARAVEDWKLINRESQRTGEPGRATALNGLAYARALAGKEIDQGLEEVNEALEMSPNEPALLDTRGYLLLLSEKKSAPELGLKDMNLAVQGMNDKLERFKSKIGTPSLNRSPFFQANKPKTWLEAMAHRNDDAAILKSAERSSAVGHYHRALIFEALGRTAGAEADRESARKLIGKEPDETLF